MHLVNRLDVMFNESLSVNLSRILLAQPFGPDDATWYGNAVLSLDTGSVVFPDSLRTEQRIADHQISSSLAMQGIYYKDENMSVCGWIEKDGYLDISWQLSKSRWSRSEAWKWPIAARDALSILLGQEMTLVVRSLQTEHVEYTELAKRGDNTCLGVLSPVLGEAVLDRGRFLRLTESFLLNRKEWNVCTRIFEQMAEAARQKTWQGQELLLGTILEAALRTLDCHPFQMGDHSWKIKDSMCRFRDKYLDDSWQKHCDNIIAAWMHVRHRNAHPDWLYQALPRRTLEQRRQDFDDVVLLCCFYGQMILALAGERPEARFPLPHEQWDPPWRMG